MRTTKGEVLRTQEGKESSRGGEVLHTQEGKESSRGGEMERGPISLETIREEVTLNQKRVKSL